MPRAESPYRDTYASLEEINRFRVSLGLQPVVRAKVACLHCGEIFKSEDAQRIRVCRRCKNLTDRETGLHDTTYQAGNIPSGEHFSMDMVSAMVR